jgi:putative transposase
MLVNIPLKTKTSISSFMGYLKGKSTLMIFDKYGNLKCKYGNRYFWCRGYYVGTVGRNKERITQYIMEQLQENMANDQLTLKKYIDPFGEKTN